LIVIDEGLYEFVYDPQVYTLLDVRVRAGRDIGKCPTHLLSDRLIIILDQVVESLQGARIDYGLSLNFIARHNIAYSSKRWH
jgi:hypothetical protein